MTGKTHALLGMASLWLLQPILSSADTRDFGLIAACAAFGALLPDLDAIDSTIARLEVAGIRPFALASAAVGSLSGHRGPLHSLAGMALFALLSSPLVASTGWPPWLTMALGYASHLLADACTRSGVPLLYPQRKRCHALPEPWRIATGSLAEEALIAVSALIVLLLLLTQLTAVPH